MDSVSPQDFSNVTEDERNAFLKVYNQCLLGEVNTVANLFSNADYKLLLTRTG
jgi:hypothetical protein